MRIALRCVDRQKSFKKASTTEIALAARKWSEFEEKAAIHIQKEARRFLADKEVKALKQSQDAAARWAAQAKAEEGAAAAQAAGTAL